MYDVGQGNSIKEGNGKVFSIQLKDYKPTCDFDEPDTGAEPIQIPLGHFNSYKSLNDVYSRESYESTTQHTNAGEISDMGLLIIISVVCLILLYLLFFKN